MGRYSRCGLAGITLRWQPYFIRDNNGAIQCILLSSNKMRIFTIPFICNGTISLFLSCSFTKTGPYSHAIRPPDISGFLPVGGVTRWEQRNPIKDVRRTKLWKKRQLGTPWSIDQIWEGFGIDTGFRLREERISISTSTSISPKMRLRDSLTSGVNFTNTDVNPRAPPVSPRGLKNLTVPGLC